MKQLFTFVLLLCSASVFAQKNKPAKADSTKPFVLGVIEEIQSKELGEKRTLNIYLPEGYSANDTTHYPVIYLLDGSADEDFIHVVGLVQFSSFPWVNRMPPSIVVGVATVDRKRDFTYPTTVAEDQKRFPTAGHSDKFISFIEKELQPFITKKYKTNGSRTLIGESLGGLLATQILLEKPQLFNKYVIISPSLWWDDGSLLKRASAMLEENYAQPTEIYIGVGKEGLAPCASPHVMEVDANLLAEKLTASKSKNIHVHFDYLPEEDHATIMHQALMNAIPLVYPQEKK